MQSYIKIKHHKNIASANLTLPASKSISNRLLMLKKTWNPLMEITNLSGADDTVLLSELLSQIDASNVERQTIINANNCGTAARFLAAYLCFEEGLWQLTGNERMQQRPMEDLLSFLQSLGAKITYLNQKGFLPIAIEGQNPSLLAQTELQLNVKQSSQYASAFLLMLPLFKQDVSIRLLNAKASFSYIQMTISLMQQAGINISLKNNVIHYFSAQNTAGAKCFNVESDWSAAAYWFVWAALQNEAEIFLKNLQKSTLQSDAVIEDLIKPFGVAVQYEKEGARIKKTTSQKPTSFAFDCNNNLDLVPCLAVLAVGTNVPITLSGIENLRFKESDRLQALINELNKVAIAKYADNQLFIHPSQTNLPQNVSFNTYGDHRLAMSFALLSACIENVFIENPNVVEKSYPNFWKNLEKLNVTINSAK